MHRTNGVVVAGNRHLTEVRITVGVQHGNQGDVELAGFEHRIRLTTLVHQDHNIGKATHVLEATQILLKTLEFATQHRTFLLGAHGDGAAGLHPLQILETVDPGLHGGPVGEHAAQPALVHIGGSAAGGFKRHHFRGLLLGANEEETLAAACRRTGPLVGVVHADGGLHEVDDVNAVARAIDVARHLGVPTTGLVPKVGTSLHHLGEGDDSHGLRVSGSPPPARDLNNQQELVSRCTRNGQVCGVKGPIEGIKTLISEALPLWLHGTGHAHRCD